MKLQEREGENEMSLLVSVCCLIFTVLKGKGGQRGETHANCPLSW